jgi:alkylation response protein AidB-like acyl-CoA dehydrogenase
MSEQRALLCDTAEAVFAEAATAGMAPVEAAGFAQLLTPDFGGDWGDAFAILRIAGAKVPHLPVGELVVGGEVTRPFGAFIRVAQSAGALDAALSMSIDHVNTRQQFGKPLAKLQAVQQVLAIFATEAAAVNVAGEAAAAALDRAGGDIDAALFEIAAAKLRTNKAIGVAASIAHQVHGAIGFTREYDLHRLTGPLLDWRSDHGNDAYWAGVLGDMAAKLGGAGLWAEVTRRGDRL